MTTKTDSLYRSIPNRAIRFRNTAIVDDNFSEERDRFDRLLQRFSQLPQLPRVVCLCGSTKFYDLFQRVNYELTMAGRIVLTVGFYPHSPQHGEGVGHELQEKVALDELHKRKIDLADDVVILNYADYVGFSTNGELAYARHTDKNVYWFEESQRRLVHEGRYEDLLVVN